MPTLNTLTRNMQTFSEITLLNYKLPLRKRLESRKVVGPYRLRPRNPLLSDSVGFYSSMTSAVSMDEHGSVIDLRLDYANTHLSSYSRLSDITGYYCDCDGHDTLQPIIARLPHGRGFLAGWTMGSGMCASIDTSFIHTKIEDAARSAHDFAEYTANNARDNEESNDDESDDAA